MSWVFGRVLEINLQYTLLSKLGGELVHHPSRKIRQSNVVNMTKSKTFDHSIVFVVDVDAVTPELLDDLHQVDEGPSPPHLAHGLVPRVPHKHVAGPLYLGQLISATPLDT